MPGWAHEIMAMILRLIPLIAAHNNGGYILEEMMSTDVELSTNNVKSPDWSYGENHPDLDSLSNEETISLRFPTITFEIANSETFSKVSEDCARLIIFSQFRIQIAVFINIERNKMTKEIETISWGTFRPSGVEIVDDQTTKLDTRVRITERLDGLPVRYEAVVIDDIADNEAPPLKFRYKCVRSSYHEVGAFFEVGS